MTAPPKHPLFEDHAAALDRYEALLAEDQALRHAEYDRPDPRRRRLRVACNDCTQPWCCNQRVTLSLVEALVIYRHAAAHAPKLLAAAVARGQQLRAKPPEDDLAFFRRRLPCPFLVDGRCGVFTVRPHRCRTHYMAGTPHRCRDELAPRDTYEMSPDGNLERELDAVADDLLFAALVEGCEPTELAETMYFLDRLVASGARWTKPTTLRF